MVAELSEASSARRIYTVEELNQAIKVALQASFPAGVWVRGEVQRLPADAARRKHVYFELHDSSGGAAASYQIPVSLLEWDRQRFGLGRYLDGSDPGFQLRDKLEVCLQCRVDFYPPYGKLSLKVIGIDPSFTLGQLEAQRREVLAYLTREGLLEKNAQLPFPVLPLRVGLITAAGSAAEKDFRTGLDGSPYRFQIDLVDCRMSGQEMEPQVIQAMTALVRRGAEVIVITRGGGSRGDLSWFDQQGVAVAVATAPVPVLTAIGHEIDRSLADVVAYRSCKTPTAAAEFLVTRLDEAAARLTAAAETLARRTETSLLHAALRLQNDVGRLELRVGQRVAQVREGMAGLRSRLAAVTLGRLAEARSEHRNRSRRLGLVALQSRKVAAEAVAGLARRLVPEHLLAGWPRQGRDLGRLGARLGRLAAASLAVAGRRLDGLERQGRLLDPHRLLARGYTLTQTVEGKVLTSVAEIAVGQRLHTRFRDGSIDSTVVQTSENRRTRRRGEPARGGKKGGKSGGEKAHSTQKRLFR